MSYVVTQDCIRCKYTDCVAVCPVNCFYEGENMLVIHPEECIDCGVCEPECAANAIIPDTHERANLWAELNQRYAAQWPSIIHKREPAPDADAWRTVPNKFPTHFSASPAKR